MLAVTWLGYPRRTQHLPTGWRRTLILLRAGILILICLLLLRPVADFQSNDQSESVLYVLSDASRSMQTEDIPGGQTRRQALLKLLESAAPSLKLIARKTEIRNRDFADAVKVTETPADVSDGTMTAHGKILELTAEEMARSRVPAVILIGDGRQAASGAMDVEPVQIARQYGRLQRPIYSVGLGSTEASNSSLDLALESRTSL